MEELNSPYHFFNILKSKDQIDFYDILWLLESKGTKIPHEIAHSLKKLMLMGERGHKDLKKDLKESIKSIERYLENIELEDSEEVLTPYSFDDIVVCDSDFESNKPPEFVTLLSEVGINSAILRGYAYTREGIKVSVEEKVEDWIYPIKCTLEEHSSSFPKGYNYWCSKEGYVYGSEITSKLDLCYLEKPNNLVEEEFE